MLDDGSQLIIQFFPKAPSNQRRAADSPTYNYTLTLPDGRVLKKSPVYEAEAAHFGTDKCDVVFGNSQFVGDYENYHIIADPHDTPEGLGADIHLKSTAKPYRPATGYFTFDNDDFYTWFCAVPSGDVTGTITYDGQAHQITGTGYHDHQWGSTSYLPLWNNWTWARQKLDDYTILTFDLVATKKYHHQRFPIVFVQNAAGDLIFESFHQVSYQCTDKYFDDQTKKNYPKVQRFDYQNNASTLQYELKTKQTIETVSLKDGLPKIIAMTIKLKGMNPSYARYLGNGELTLQQPGQPTIHRSGELIYEFMYPGAENFDQLI